MKNNELKSENKLSVLRCLYKNSASRVDLANSLGLSKASVSSVIDGLREEGFICEIGRGNSSESGGKKPIIISVNPWAALILAVHFDGSMCGVAFTDMRGEILDSRYFPIIWQTDYAQTLDVIFEQAVLLKEQLAETKIFRIAACGISVKGLVDSVCGVIKYTSANADWENIPIAGYFSAKLGIPVYVDNDARAVSCRESVYGSQSDSDMIACVCIESGIGTSVLMGNHIIQGAFFGAVNFAHTTVDRDGPLCRCGKRGCWESLASLDALVSSVCAISPKYVKYTLEDVYAAYQANDTTITGFVLNIFCFWIGVGVANMLTVFNPRKLLLYVPPRLFNAAAQEAVLHTIAEYTNRVTAKTQIFFKDDLHTLHLQAAAAIVIKRFLSPKTHMLFLSKKCAQSCRNTGHRKNNLNA